MDDLAQRFAALPTDLRLQSLQNILLRLSGYEWRDAQKFLAQRKFHKDIIGDDEMPLELIIQVMKHLPIKAAFIYQRVSRAWRYKLNSPHLFGPLLVQSQDRFFKAPTAYERNGGLVDETRLSKIRAERLARILDVRPSKVFQIRLSQTLQQVQADRLELVPTVAKMRSDALILGPKHGKLFMVLNLGDGSFHKILLPGRVSGSIAYTTKSYVVFSTATYMFAYHIGRLGDAPSRLRKPSADFVAHCDDNVSVIVFGRNSDHRRREVVVWDMNKDSSHTFIIKPAVEYACDYCRSDDPEETHGLMHIWVNAQSGKILFFFTCLTRDRSEFYVRIMQTDLQGSVLYDGHLEFSYWHRARENVEEMQQLAYQGRVDGVEGSDTVRITLGHSPLDLDFIANSICFDVDSGSTPPLHPESLDVWLAAHPSTRHVTRRYGYDGERTGQGYFHLHLQDPGPWSVTCHCYRDLNYARQCNEYHRTENSELLSTVNRREYQATTFDFRGTVYTPGGQVAGAQLGDLFYFAVSGRPVKPKGMDAYIEIYPVYRNLVSETRTHRAPWCKSTETSIPYVKEASRDPKQRAHMSRMFLSESYAVVQFKIETPGEEAGVAGDMMFMVLAFDPSYVMPQWDQYSEQFLSITECGQGFPGEPADSSDEDSEEEDDGQNHEGQEGHHNEDDEMLDVEEGNDDISD